MAGGCRTTSHAVGHRRWTLRRQLALTAGPQCKVRPAVAVSPVASAHHQGRFLLNNKAWRLGDQSCWFAKGRARVTIPHARKAQAMGI
jgi:hypothetical protein